MDRSGSMQAVREDAEGGVNAFVDEQRREPGEAVLTLVQFDTEYEFVHRGVPIDEVPPYRLQPRGMTALLDAVGRAIDETGARLARTREPDRPGLVVFVVMTDGEENSSQEFTKDRVKAMIEHQQWKYGWQFTFLGANQDAFAEAGGLGIDSSGAANYSPRRTAAAWSGTSSKVARMRKARAAGQRVSNEFTEEERRQMS